MTPTARKLPTSSVNHCEHSRPERLTRMAPGDEKPQSPEVQQFRINRMERDLSELVKTVKSLADLVQAQEVRREAEREQRGRERKDDQEHRAESALSLQQWGLILTVATIAFTLAGGVVAPFLQKMILGG